MGTFGSLSTAASGMNAARAAMEVISHNIANANTPGFKRQQVILAEGNPPNLSTLDPSTAAWFTGTGVQVKGVRRIQEAYLDQRINTALQSKAQWSVTSDLLTTVESQFNELGDNGVAALLDNFWNEWRDLAASPHTQAPRGAVLASADALATRIREIYASLRGQQSQLDVTVSSRAAEINRIASEIAQINEKIVALAPGGSGPNELLNTRDQLVDELSQYVNVSAHGTTGQDFIVNVGGVTLVQGTLTRRITTEQNVDGHLAPVWEDGTGALSITSGELRGVLNVRDGYIPSYLQALDTLCAALTEQVNAIHSTGYAMDGSTGRDFFTAGTTGATFSVNAELLADSHLVAASANGEQSNAEVAQAIADLSDRLLISGQTISQSYVALATRIGQDAASAEGNASTRSLTLQQLEMQRQSVSGVSLDEELADMVRFQQSYAASARVFQATNYMLEVLLEEAR